MKNRLFIIRNKKVFITALIVMINFVDSKSQSNPIPYLLENGRWIYVKEGTPNNLVQKQFIRTTKFANNGNAIIYDSENYSENIPSALGGTVQRTRDIKVAYLVNRELKILKKVIDFRLPMDSRFDDLIEPLDDIDEKNTYYKYLNNGFKGIITSTGKEIYPAKDFKEFTGISNDRIISSFYSRDYQSYQSGLLDLNGNIILPLSPIKFLDNKFKYGLIPYEVNNKCGYMDKDGNEIIFPQYKNCSSFILGMATVDNGDNGLVINTKNKIIGLGNYIKSLTGSQYVTYEFIDKNKIDYSTDSGFIALIDHKSNNVKLPNPVKSIALILLDKNLKVINRLTLPLHPNDDIELQLVSIFGGNIKLKNKSYNFDSEFLFWNFKTGSIDRQIEKNTIISDGLYVFSDKENGLGYKNEKHQIVIQAKYIACSPFKFGLAIVQDIRGQYIIDKTEKIILRLGNKYSKYNLEIVSPSLLICKDNSAYCYDNLEGCKDFYLDLNGYEYRDSEQNLKLKDK